MTSSSPFPELPAFGFLSEVDPSHREFLASFGGFIRPTNGETIIEEGKPQVYLHLILSGMLHVTSAAGGRSLLVATLGAGDSIGEVNVFDPASASASVIARSECLIWRITAAELADFFSASPEGGIDFMRGLLRLAARRLRAMNEKLADSEKRAEFHDFWKADE
jgi:CRP/FNR family cyclic AMP-dependent transcriptional regulator